MEQFEIQVDGAPVIYSDRKPPPYNPLHRPEIHYRKPILALVLFLVVLGALIAVGVMYAKPWTVWMCLGWGIVFFAVIAKRALIWCVHLYQNKASDATRLKCVFEPSCSEYMILAVNKYGFFRGVYKGIRRLLRCHPPNGGRDYP